MPPSSNPDKDPQASEAIGQSQKKEDNPVQSKVPGGNPLPTDHRRAERRSQGAGQREPDTRSESAPDRRQREVHRQVEDGSADDRPPELSMLDDGPAVRDALDYTPYAKALAGLISSPETKTPLVLAINAPWGAGKSTLANLIQDRLTTERKEAGLPPYTIVHFNAWMNDDAPNLAAAFAATVTRGVVRDWPWWRKLVKPLPFSLWSPRSKRALHYSLLLTALGLAIGVVLLLTSGQIGVEVAWLRDLLGLGKPDEAAKTLATRGGAAITIAIMVATATKSLLNVGREIAKFVSDPNASASKGTVGEVRTEIGELVGKTVQESWVVKVAASMLLWKAGRKAGESDEDRQNREFLQSELAKQRLLRRKRVVVFIDDLERCKPPRAVEVLETINLLMNHHGLVAVVLADMRALATVTGVKYKDLASAMPMDGDASAPNWSILQSFGRSYLQKIVQVQFDLPPPSPEHLRRMVEPASVAPDEAEASPSAAPKDKPLIKVDWKLMLGFYWKLFGHIPVAAFVFGIFAGAYYLVKYSVSLAIPLENYPALIEAFDIIALGAAAIAAVGQFIVSMMREAISTAAAMFVRARREVQGGATTTEGVEEELRKDRQDTSGARSSNEALMSQAAQAAIFKENDENLITARQEAFKYIPELPRNVKRLENSLRVLLFVASERKLLKPNAGSESPLTLQAIGSWAALKERWPEVGYAITDECSILALLETAAEEDRDNRRRTKKVPLESEVEPAKNRAASSALKTALKEVAPNIEPDGRLEELLTQEQRLSQWVENLVKMCESKPKAYTA